MAKIQRALIAYSILKDQLERGDLYEGLMIFFRPITSSLANTQFIPSEFSDQLNDKYGLSVPSIVIESLTEKMLTSGLIYKNAESKGVASFKYSELDTIKQNLSLPLINELLESFILFAKSQNDEISNLTNDYLEQAFFDRLLHIETLQILSRKDGQYSQKKTSQTITKTKQINSNINLNPVEFHLDYVVSRFIIELQEEDIDKFNFLNDVATANLAAETLLSYRDPPKKGEAFDEVEIYLDAPLCLDILGVNVGKQQFGYELATALKSAGVKVNIFLHSVSEIERVLDAKYQSYLSSTNSVGRNQVDPPEVQSLVKAIVGHSEQIFIESYGFNIVDSSEVIPAIRRAAIDAEYEKLIRDQLTGWASEVGKEVDINTCCDLIRMRSGIKIQSSILKSGVILVTRNSTVMNAANSAWRKWMSEKKYNQDRIRKASPLAILDKYLIGLLWITQGGNSGDLSRSHLIANCSSAISTKKDVISKVYNTLIETSPQSALAFEAIINDQRAERTLMNITFGDSELVTNENVFPILEKIRIETAGEVIKSKNEEIANIESNYDTILKNKNDEVIKISKQLDDVNSEIKKYRKAESDRIKNEEIIKLQVFKDALKYACITYKIVTVLIVFIVATIIFLVISNITFPNTNNLSILIAKIFLAVIGGGFVFSWDIPDMLFSPYRIKASNFVLNYYIKKKITSDINILYSLNYKEKKIIPVS